SLSFIEFVNPGADVPEPLTVTVDGESLEGTIPIEVAIGGNVYMKPKTNFQLIQNSLPTTSHVQYTIEFIPDEVVVPQSNDPAPDDSELAAPKVFVPSKVSLESKRTMMSTTTKKALQVELAPFECEPRSTPDPVNGNPYNAALIPELSPQYTLQGIAELGGPPPRPVEPAGTETAVAAAEGEDGEAEVEGEGEENFAFDSKGKGKAEAVDDEESELEQTFVVENRMVKGKGKAKAVDEEQSEVNQPSIQTRVWKAAAPSSSSPSAVPAPPATRPRSPCLAAKAGAASSSTDPEQAAPFAEPAADLTSRKRGRAADDIEETSAASKKSRVTSPASKSQASRDVSPRRTSVNAVAGPSTQPLAAPFLVHYRSSSSRAHSPVAGPSSHPAPIDDTPAASESEAELTYDEIYQ
ncbi:hypothetical protein R3P38DRAFT_503334, partial [Favolaschia claudopus]